jgi:hypothetical protein
MRRFFTRERFGRPQFLAALLLSAFLSQCLWLVHLELKGGNGLDMPEEVRIGEGWRQWHGRGIAGTPFLNTDASIPTAAEYDGEHSPLLSLASAAPLVAWPGKLGATPASHWGWLPRLPFLFCGVLLGASLWYVARRLCGNPGGYVALTLYCFSPAMVQATAVWHTEPEIVAAWGSFGAVFTAIAVAHTLYAPREVVLWNWRRITLLGISLALAVGSQFSLIVVAPVALAFLLYVAPIRRAAGVVIWISASAIAFVLLFATYFFNFAAFWKGMRHAGFWGATWRAFTMPAVYGQVLLHTASGCPAFVLTVPIALVTYLAWPRTRYFGNTAPLAVAVLFLALGMAHPHLAGAGFLLSAIPFLMIFVAGVLADLAETRYQLLILAGEWGLLGAYALRCLVSIARVQPG